MRVAAVTAMHILIAAGMIVAVFLLVVSIVCTVWVAWEAR